MMNGEQQNVVDEFEKKLQQVYDGNLKRFCDAFSTHEAFYRKVQKAKWRMKNKSVKPEAIDNFRKYILFLDHEILMQKLSPQEKKQAKRIDQIFN